MFAILIIYYLIHLKHKEYSIFFNNDYDKNCVLYSFINFMYTKNNSYVKVYICLYVNPIYVKC